MANKGKPWSSEHDALLTENVEKTNMQLAELLGRSAHGIECRRAVLAASLHRDEPSASIEECISRFCADPEQAKRVLKRQKIGGSQIEPTVKKSKPTPESEVIAEAAKCILEGGGDLFHGWSNPKFVPVMIKHYGGFQAYASAVRTHGETESDSFNKSQL